MWRVHPHSGPRVNSRALSVAEECIQLMFAGPHFYERQVRDAPAPIEVMGVGVL